MATKKKASRKRPAVRKHVPGEWLRYGVSPSRLLVFLDCQQKCALRYLGWSPRRRAVGLAFGSIGHDAAEAVYRAVWGDEVDNTDKDNVRHWLNGWLDDYPNHAREWNDTLEENYEEWAAFLEALLPEYFTQWSDEDNARQWLVAEQKLTPMFGPYKLNGRVDYLFRQPSKRVGGSVKLWLMDNKFLSRVDEDMLEDGLLVDFQMQFYMLVVRLVYGEDPGGAVYNIIRRPNLRRKKDEKLVEFRNRIAEDVEDRPDHYFKRFEIPFDPEVQERFEQDLMGIIKDYEEWDKAGCPVRLHGNPCIGKYGLCEFFAFCHYGDRTLYEQREWGQKKGSK